VVEQRARPASGDAAFRHVFEVANEAILLADVESRTILDANPAACALFGYTYDELIGLQTADLVHADFLELYTRFAHQPDSGIALLGRHKDGSPLDGEVMARDVEYGGRSVRCVVIREIKERARAVESMESRVAQRTKQLAALLRISQALGSTLDLHRLLDLVLEQLATVVEYTEAFIAYEEGAELRVNAYRGSLPPEIALSIRQPLEHAPIYDAVRQRGGPVIISDVRHGSGLGRAYRDTFRRRDQSARYDPGSVLGVPLVSKDRIVGVLHLNHMQPRFYSQAHADMALAIANQASLAIENARLFELEERRTKELESLYSAEEALYRTLEPRDVLDGLVRAATDLLQADKTSVLLWDAGHQLLTVQAAHGFQPEALERMSYVAGDGLTSLAAVSGEILATEDAQHDPRISMRLRAINQSENIRGLICVPIHLGPEVFGVLNLQYHDVRTFSTAERRLLRAFAQRAAMALQNAQLFEAERTTRERLDVALQAASMGTWEWDIGSNAVVWSPQLEVIHGLEPGTFAGTMDAVLTDIHPDDVHLMLGMIEDARHSDRAHGEYRIIWPDGSIHWLEATGRVVSDTKGRIIGMRGVCQDVTARKQEEAERVQLEERERVASAAHAALSERQRLARELHDSVSQVLYGIALGSQTAVQALHDQSADAEDALTYVHKLAEAAITEMRALIFELRPESLEQDGLVAALERQAAAMQARHGVEVKATFEREPEIGIDKKEAVYRIAQEALHNVARHARAHRVQLELRSSNGHVVLQVSDDGVGFDARAKYTGHLGLVSMRERAAAVGGTLSIDSQPGGGARVIADVPR
jgi:PAS domain S-box-containing protein